MVSLVRSLRKISDFDIVSPANHPLTLSALKDLVESEESHMDRIYLLMKATLSPETRPARKLDLCRRYCIAPSYYRIPNFAKKINNLYYGHDRPPKGGFGRHLN